MVSTTVQRTEWPRAAQIGVTVTAAASMVLFLTGLVFTIPISIVTLIVGIVAGRELGRFRLAVIILSVLGILLAVGWMLLSLDVGGLVPPAETEQQRQGVVDE